MTKLFAHILACGLLAFPLTGHAQSTLPLQQQADLLLQKIELSIANDNALLALELIDQYKSLGIKLPLPLRLAEGRLAAIQKDFVRSRSALSMYLSDPTSRSQPGYPSALSLYDAVDKMNRDISGCKIPKDDDKDHANRISACNRIISNPSSSREMIGDAYHWIYASHKIDSPDALNAINSAINSDPTRHFLYFKRSLIWSSTKDFKKAAEDMTQAISLRPNYPYYLIDRGYYFYKIKEYEKAIRDETAALEIDPQLVGALNIRASAYLEVKKHDLALLDLDRAIELHPTSESYERRGQARHRLGQLEAALADMSEAARLEPGRYSPRNLSCWYRATANQDLKLALSDCNEAIRIDPKRAAAYDSRALVHYKNKNWELAYADYKAANNLSPNRAAYIYGMGLSLINMGKKEEGKFEIERAQAINPNIATEQEANGLILQPDTAFNLRIG